MRIIVLDGYTLNPGDLDWSGLEKLGECHVYPRTEPRDVLERAREAEVVLTNKTVLGRDVILQLPTLRYIGVLATGYNVVDVETAKQRGVCVTNVPSYGTESVAQMVFAHLLNLTQHVAEHSNSVRNGNWSRCNDFCYWLTPLIELSGLTMGIVGFGRIGRQTARIANAFGMCVIYYDPFVPSVPDQQARPVPLDELFCESDVISLHCPLTPETELLVNRDRIALMKPGAFLINTSRGPLVDEHALAEALNSGRIAGAGLDVLSVEPPPANNPLLGAKNCFITPHIAWATQAARKRLMDIAISNVRAFLEGRPQNVVNP
ncbi:MAG: D-2-hydroxyacid dehydrogenase [Verrucomicrobiae bacterium]|nr:D-2-hydroxyacid dehydrogenase [Verrucomicrobiae bacterium]